jgi:hypothetical protein
MPIAVIITGVLLSKAFDLKAESGDQEFKVGIPKVLKMRAIGDQAVFGFALFIIALLVLGLTAGKAAYTLFKRQFGIDPGQFDALCILSSFACVAVASVILLATNLTRRYSVKSARSLVEEHERLITDLSGRRGPIE